MFNQDHASAVTLPKENTSSPLTHETHSLVFLSMYVAKNTLYLKFPAFLSNVIHPIVHNNFLYFM